MTQKSLIRFSWVMLSNQVLVWFIKIGSNNTYQLKVGTSKKKLLKIERMIKNAVYHSCLYRWLGMFSKICIFIVIGGLFILYVSLKRYKENTLVNNIFIPLYV